MKHKNLLLVFSLFVFMLTSCNTGEPKVMNSISSSQAASEVVNGSSEISEKNIAKETNVEASLFSILHANFKEKNIEINYPQLSTDR